MDITRSPIPMAALHMKNTNDTRVKSLNPRHASMTVDERLNDPPKYEEEVG